MEILQKAIVDKSYATYQEVIEDINKQKIKYLIESSQNLFNDDSHLQSQLTHSSLSSHSANESLSQHRSNLVNNNILQNGNELLVSNILASSHNNVNVD